MAKPKWIAHLPKWATSSKDGIVEVEAGVVYPLWLEKMVKLDPSLKGINEEITQHALEAARLLFTRFLKKIMYDHGGKRLYLRILSGKDKKWALAKYPVGTPIDRNEVKRKLGLDKVLGG